MKQILDIIKDKNWTITTAESCTGGLLATAITDISGASDVFKQGYITYANTAKNQLLDVPESILETVGAVSKETAEAMAEGALKKSRANIALATTGIAGPTGGTKEKPVGTVYIAVAIENTQTATKLLQLKGSREEIRQQTVTALIDFTKTILN